jgi:Smg protein
MFDILVFVYEHCRQADLSDDPERVARRLSAAGFEDADICAALTWLAGVARAPQHALTPLPDRDGAFRAYAPREAAKLDADGRGLLLALERSGILSAQLRERVLERALATADRTLTLDQLKLIVLMVLWHEQAPGRLLMAEELRSSGGTRLPH